MRIPRSAFFAVILLASCSDSVVDPLDVWQDKNYTARFYVTHGRDVFQDHVDTTVSIAAVFDDMDSLGVHAGMVKWNDMILRSRSDALMSGDGNLMGTAYYLNSTEDTFAIAFGGAANRFTVSGSSRVAPLAAEIASLAEPMSVPFNSSGGNSRTGGFELSWVRGNDPEAKMTVWIVATDTNGYVSANQLSTQSAVLRGIEDKGVVYVTPSMLSNIPAGPIGIAIARYVEKEVRLADRRRVLLTMRSGVTIRMLMAP